MTYLEANKNLPYVKILKDLQVTGNITTAGTFTASNLSILGDYTILNTTTSNTEQIIITNAGTGPALKVTQTGAFPIAEFYDDNQVIVLKVADGGNVGIGTVEPLQKLHVQGSVLATTQVLGPATDAVTAPGFSWSGDANTGMYRPGTDMLGLVTAGVERVRVLDNGNVGIGTTNPLFNLDIRGRLAIRPFNIDSNVVYFGSGIGANQSGLGIYALDNTPTSAWILNAGYSGVQNNSICINSGGGNVGIGLTNPQDKLSVNGDMIASRYTIRKGVGNDLLSYIGFSQAAGVYVSHDNAVPTVVGLAINACGARPQPIAVFKNGGGGPSIIAEAGYVGIGITNPTAPLDVRGYASPGFAVSGGVYFNNGSSSTLSAIGGGTATNATIRADNHIYAIGFAAYSDERIKTSTQPIINGLECLRKIKPTSYIFIDTIRNTSNRDYGFIAQQVQPVLPSSVFTQVEFIPSVYKIAKVNELKQLLLDAPHDLSVGDKVKLVAISNEEFVASVATIIDIKSFTIHDTECLSNTEKIFVYGKEVNDYHVLKKDTIYTMGISAILELDSQVELLKIENKSVKAKIDYIERALGIKGDLDSGK